MIARFLKRARQVKVAPALKRRTAYRPESENERLACQPDPFFGQIEHQITRTVHLESGITDDQGGVVFFEHLVEVRLHGSELPSTTHPLFEQHLGQRDRSYRGGVESNGSHLLRRNFADQQNGSHGAA